MNRSVNTNTCIIVGRKRPATISDNGTYLMMTNPTTTLAKSHSSIACHFLKETKPIANRNIISTISLNTL
jgi:hypothetical protein